MIKHSDVQPRFAFATCLTSRTRVLFAAPLLLTFPLLLTASCDEKKSPQAHPSEPGWDVADDTLRPASGPSYNDEDFSFEAKAPERCATHAPMNPASGLIRISVPVTLRGLSNREVPVTAMSFTLNDKEGHTYRPTLAGCHPSLKSTELSSQRQLEAHIAFDVPASTSDWELTFHPFLLGRKEVRAQVEVPSRR